MEIRQRIKDCIDEKGLKQYVVANKAGFSQKQFSSMLTGRRKIYAEDLGPICAALNVPVGEFIKPELTKAG